MKEVILDLNEVIESISVKLNSITDDDFACKPAPEKWSKKEVIGHLIDSAQNNLRRFICGQYETVPPKIVYDQNFWVTANSYQTMKREDLIKLWILVNQQIIHVLRQMPENNYVKTAITSEAKTLTWLAADYVKHMKHHLNQVIANSYPVSYP